MTARRALPLVIALVVLAAPALAAAGAFAFAAVGGRLVVVGSGSGAVAVGALGMAMGASMSARSLGTPIPSLLVVEAVPLDAEITLGDGGRREHLAGCGRPGRTSQAGAAARRSQP